MIDEKNIKEAESNIPKYLEEGLLSKKSNETAKQMYVENSEMSLETADNLIQLEKEDYKPYLWVIVTSYYSMFYIANAVLLKLGYKVGEKVSHKVTQDCLIALVRDKLKAGLLDEYGAVKDEALEIISSKTDSIIQTFEYERQKRSTFQYEMGEEVKRSKCLTSLERAKNFVFEMKKLL